MTITMNMPNLSLASILSRKPQYCLGLDIGSHAVKLCELERSGGGFRVLSLGSSRLPMGAVEDGVLQNPEAVAAAIRNLVKNLKSRVKKAAISISGYSVIVKKISLAAMSDEDMEKHIHAEAEQYIPFDIDDVYLDFQNLATNTADEERTDVMLVAAKKDVVDAYLAMLKDTGLAASVVDVDAFALENSFEDNMMMENENVVLVDIGASKMNINIIHRGTSILARDVAVGSRQLSEQIEARLGVGFEEAERLKLGEQAAGEHKRELEEIFASTCRQWINEIRRAMDFFTSNYQGEAIARVVVSGGGARVAGFTDFLARETDVPVEVFNPFSRITYDSGRIDPEYLAYMAPEMAISVGLATRPVEI
ncbi:MAG: type IV pilus assembly protein PilM [Thermodesulfobacteriota bacterium]